jgi:hypothetical protein
MHKISVFVRRSSVLLLMVIGLVGFTMNPAAARELCNENSSLSLADGDGDGVVSRGEIQAIINAAGDAEGVDQLQALLDGLPGDVTGIRYVDCPADGGSGDDGTGDDGSGTGDDGSGTGDDGSGTGDGSGDGNGSGDGSGTGTEGDGSTEGGAPVLNAEGTPVDPVTGLPDTGQGSPSSDTGSAPFVLFGIAGVVALIAVAGVRIRNQAR